MRFGIGFRFRVGRLLVRGDLVLHVVQLQVREFLVKSVEPGVVECLLKPGDAEFMERKKQIEGMLDKQLNQELKLGK